MKFKKVVLGMCLIVSVLVFFVMIKVSVCCDEYLKFFVVLYDIDSKLLYKFSWFVDNLINIEVNMYYWFFK